MNIFQALREDHQKQRTLIRLLVKTHRDSIGREEILSRLKEAVDSHARAEERHFYSALMQHPASRERAEQCAAAHREVDQLIGKLAATDPSAADWIATAQKLQERLTAHLDEEEQEVFLLAEQVLSGRDGVALASHYLDSMEQAEEQAAE